MTDPTPYPLPAVRIHADYASTDGRVPDALTIEYAERPSLDHIGNAVAMLAAVADRRDTFTVANLADDLRRPVASGGIIPRKPGAQT